jgi:hypothetical protein
MRIIIKISLIVLLTIFSNIADAQTYKYLSYPSNYYYGSFNSHNHQYNPEAFMEPWEKAGQTKEEWVSQHKISYVGWGFFLSYRQQWYDNEVMNHFKRVSMFSMDLDFLINKWIITGNAAFGGGKLYDSLNALEFEWQPQTKLATTNYSIFLGYALKDERVIKVSPFVGFQIMKIKLKPDSYMVSPVGLDNMLSSPWSPSIGLNVEIKNNKYRSHGKTFGGGGLRISYSYTILKFAEMNGYMHQLTLGLGGGWRFVSKK